MINSGDEQCLLGALDMRKDMNDELLYVSMCAYDRSTCDESGPKLF